METVATSTLQKYQLVFSDFRSVLLQQLPRTSTDWVELVGLKGGKLLVHGSCHGYLFRDLDPGNVHAKIATLAEGSIEYLEEKIDIGAKAKVWDRGVALHDLDGWLEDAENDSDQPLYHEYRELFAQEKWGETSFRQHFEGESIEEGGLVYSPNFYLVHAALKRAYACLPPRAALSTVPKL